MKINNQKKAKGPDVKWSVAANCFDPANPDSPILKDLAIPSNERSVTMIGSTVHSGMPVDANLAVHFIKNLLDNYQIHVQNHNANFERFVEDTNFEGLRDLYKTSKKIGDSVVKVSYGITFDKDMILKIISQPKCEGLRSYLCARPIPPDGELHLSLAIVGVDKDGVDLHYNLRETAKPSELMLGADNVITQSLTVEYGTPPPPPGLAITGGGEHIAELQLDPRYSLLQFASKTQTPPAPTPIATPTPIAVTVVAPTP
jgi:hypothetical protein